MGKEVRLFKSEEKMTRSNLSAFLHQLADVVAIEHIRDHEEDVCFTRGEPVDVPTFRRQAGLLVRRYGIFSLPLRPERGDGGLNRYKTASR